MKTAFLLKILSVVEEVCEISGDEIRSHVKRQDIVDARVIFVFYCSKYGFPAATIANFIRRKRICSIRDMLANHKYFSAQSASFRLMSAEVGKKLADMFPIPAR